jgi:dihydroorotase-like cyclic amidohydrolase
MVTVESTANYLTLTDEDIDMGDVRLKVYPPIRNAKNLHLLWEQL